MRFFDQGSHYSVVVTEMDIDRFNDSWPASELRGLRGVTFQFEKRNGDLVDIEYRNGDSEQWDGSALVALSEDAQKYGESRLGKTRKGWPATYTTAPPDYDWFGTFTEASAGTTSQGKHVRKVRSDPQYVDSQRGRYMSGNHMAVDEVEWKKLVKYKLVTVSKSLSCNPCKEGLEANPLSNAGMLVAAAVAAGIAWLAFRKDTSGAAPKGPCASVEQLGEFSKVLKYKLWYVGQQAVATWKPASAEYTGTASSRAYSAVDCSFYKWDGSSWVVDASTNAELSSYLSPISIQGVFVGL